MPFLQLFRSIFEHLRWCSGDFRTIIFIKPYLCFVSCWCIHFIEIISQKEVRRGQKRRFGWLFKIASFWHVISIWSSWRKLDCWIRSVPCFALVFDELVVQKILTPSDNLCCYTMLQWYFRRYSFFLSQLNDFFND